jgi:hypothetical protein
MTGSDANFGRVVDYKMTAFAAFTSEASSIVQATTLNELVRS